MLMRHECDVLGRNDFGFRRNVMVCVFLDKHGVDA